MPTQSIEVKDFTGGRNMITSPFNLYPTEAVEFSNISLDGTGMRTRNFIPDKKLIAPKLQGPWSIAPKLGEFYEISHAISSLTEKVRYYQGNRYFIKNGTPYQLGAHNEMFSTTIANPWDRDNVSLPQTVFTAPADGNKVKVVHYRYFISYRSAKGFESPLEEIGAVNGHKTWDENFSKESASQQTITVLTAPKDKEFGRIYRMGDNISFPSLVFQFDHEWHVNLQRSLVTGTGGTFNFASLDDTLGDYASTWGTVHPTDLKYLTATKYGLAAAHGSQIYLSMVKPDAWSALSMLNMGSKITGIASVYRGFVVFTENTDLYMITGSNIENLQVNILSTDIGCSSNASIAEVGQHALIWVYDRRFYVFDGASVRELEPNTYDFNHFVRHGLEKEVPAVSMYNKYLITDDKEIIMVDLHHKYKPFINYDADSTFKNPPHPMYIKESLVDGKKFLGMYHTNGSFYSLRIDTYKDVQYVDLVPATDNWDMGCYWPQDCPEGRNDTTSCLKLGIYGAYDAGNICIDGAVIGRFPKFDLGLVPKFHLSDYLSPMFTFGDLNGQCTFSSVEVLFEGELVIFIYVDSVEVVYSEEYLATTPSTARLVIPNHVARGNYLQIRLRFNGVVHGYRVNGEPLEQLSK